MTRSIIEDILEGVDRWESIVRVVITHTLGSAPRKAGSSMIVSTDDFSGTIGGGRLEYLALQKARDFLSIPGSDQHSWPRMSDNFVLGTELRQCCGGVVWLLFERFDLCHITTLRELQKDLKPEFLLTRNMDDHTPPVIEIPPCQGNMGEPSMQKDEGTGATRFLEPALSRKSQLFIYGAGHVGRALVHVLENTPFDITWVDIHQDRFPKDTKKDINTVIAAKPAKLAIEAPLGAYHVVMTHSHEIDLEICRTLLTSGSPAYLGLIASKTKRTKFINRFRNEGIREEAFSVFHCPIGLHTWSSSEPSVIAISIGAELIDVCEQEQYSWEKGDAGNRHAVGGMNDF